MGGLTCHSINSFWSLLYAILLKAYEKHILQTKRVKKNQTNRETKKKINQTNWQTQPQLGKIDNIKILLEKI